MIVYILLTILSGNYISYVFIRFENENNLHSLQTFGLIFQEVPRVRRRLKTRAYICRKFVIISAKISILVRMTMCILLNEFFLDVICIMSKHRDKIINKIMSVLKFSIQCSISNCGQTTGPIACEKLSSISITKNKKKKNTYRHLSLEEAAQFEPISEMHKSVNH